MSDILANHSLISLPSQWILEDSALSFAPELNINESYYFN